MPTKRKTPAKLKPATKPRLSPKPAVKASAKAKLKPVGKKRDPRPSPRPRIAAASPPAPSPKAAASAEPSAPSPASAVKDPQTTRAAQSQAYERHKERAAERQRTLSRSGNDIGPIPDCQNPNRREACLKDPEKFYREYFPGVFKLPFSGDHREIIGVFDDVLFNGGFVPLVMPRGSGKTAICRRLAIRGLIYGIRRYLFYIGATADMANRSLNVIKRELRFNPLLLADFPEICWPIIKLEGKAIKAVGQHVGGEPTSIIWTEGRLVLPTIAGSKASGAMIDVAGITGQIRGRNELRSDGTEVRPDMFILDDPQTKSSAMSDGQCNTREEILIADIIEGAGPGEETCGIVPCTIIRKGDFADRLFDRDRHPEFDGYRYRAIKSLPTNTAAWERFEDVLRDALAEKDKTGKINAYYREHQAELEEGAVVAWPERKKKKYVTALQELMTLKILKPGVYGSEYDGEPPDLSVKRDDELAADVLCHKLTRLDRGIVPADATALTAFIDVQKNLLYYAVLAWAEGFSGSIIDHGTWPKTGRTWFKLNQIAPDFLARATGKTNLEEQLYEGMKRLTTQLLGREWQREAGGVARVGLCLIDGNWPESKNVVYQFCRQSPFAAILMPSRGHYYGAKNKPISDQVKKEGVRRGLEWEIPNPVAGRPTRHLHWDTNFWKSHIAGRLAAPMGSQGCLSLFGSDHRAHRMLCEHLTSEYRVRVEVPGRAVDEWQQTPGADNHWWDCVVGAGVAASVLGVALKVVHTSSRPKPSGPTLTINEIKALRAQERQAKR